MAIKVAEYRRIFDDNSTSFTRKIELLNELISKKFISKDELREWVYKKRVGGLIDADDMKKAFDL